MLPVENLADVVSFLGYYDLGGLKLSSKRFSALAQQCADQIRIFDLSDLEFCVEDIWIDVNPLGAPTFYLRGWPQPRTSVCRLRPSCEYRYSMADFISAAFRNCTIGRITLAYREHFLDVIRAVADTIVVADLQVNLVWFNNIMRLIELIDSFRRVEVRLTKW
ncbi:hypothetical protein AAVH_40824 [Aphelenchoides avenae]|nr:hypothetical protein AAVH_40824 [Aphelenchus avenae]